MKKKIKAPVAKANSTTIFKVEDKANKTNDGFRNLTAALGVSSGGCEDNMLSNGHYEFNLITRQRVQLEAAYRGSWIVGQVIDCVAEDMVRAGIEITTSEDAERVADLQVEMKRKQIWTSLSDTVKWGRLYGGAIAVMQIKGAKLSEPLDVSEVGEGDFLGLVVYDRWQLAPTLMNVIESGPDMGLPKYYDIVLGKDINDPGKDAGSEGRVRVHHSRCVPMYGHRLPFFQAITEMMWGESVLERMWDRLIAFDTATLSTGNLINRAQLRTIGVEGLRDILSAGGEAQEALLEMFEHMRQLQSNEGLTLIDKVDTFASTAYTFSGLSDVLIQFGQQVSGAAQIPLVRLFGQSPAGMSATGESDIRLYYDGINSKQEATLRNPLEILLKVMWRSMTGEAAPKDLAFEFTPLWQMSATDKATIATNNTNTIIAAHDAGAIKTATMMKELKQSSGNTGLFTHITDEEIDDAENDEPPEPAIVDPNADPAAALKKPVGDSSFARIKKWLSRDAKNEGYIPIEPMLNKQPPKGSSGIPSKRVMTADRKKIREFIK